MREYILTNEEARLIDRYTMGELGVPGVHLMGQAGSYVSATIKSVLKEMPGKRIDFFCGTGNNGGDGFVAAYDCQEWGAYVNVWIVGSKEKIKGEALHYFERLQRANCRIVELKCEDDFSQITDLYSSDLIVDAMLGTGFKGEVRGLIRKAIELINEIDRPTLAVDIPSGVIGDSGAIGGVAIHADYTVTMGFFKRGLLLYPGRARCGEITMAQLDYPPEAFQLLKSKTYLLDEDFIASILPGINGETHKHRRGKVFIIAGSIGMTGAATLASLGALRVGAGLVINAIPRSLNTIMEIKLTESMTLPVSESPEGTFSKAAVTEMVEKIEWADTVLIGPGIGRSETVREFIQELYAELIKHDQKVILIDADGLRATTPENLAELRQKHGVILTPHRGEFRAFTGMSIDQINENPIDISREFAVTHQVILVLKGAPTIIATPDGVVHVNSTGNPGLATGGTGDVLSGVIAGFAAQSNINPQVAAFVGNFIHGLAADIATDDLGIRGLIASDLLNYIPDVLKEFDYLT